MPMPASGKHGRTTSEETIDLIRRLASRYDDTTIAQILGQQNRRTATWFPFRKAHVRELRAYHGIPGDQPLRLDSVTAGRRRTRSPASIGRAGMPGSASPAPPSTGGCAMASSPASSSPPGHPGRSASAEQLRDMVPAQAPDGWLPLSQAASHLGVARQTVSNKVQRGELNAVYLTQGRRKGLRIQVGCGQAGLFDTP